MSFLNVEIKARLADEEIDAEREEERFNTASFIREYLMSKGATFKGTDKQTDTYFQVSQGRLKLREGNIENNLIFYNRIDKAGPKQSHFNLVKVEDANGLKEILTQSNGIKVIVKKIREIYYIGNVKFHLDEVPGLGTFTEIEAGNLLADLQLDQLQEQCNFYMNAFGIRGEDLVDISYSDMLLANTETT